LKIR